MFEVIKFGANISLSQHSQSEGWLQDPWQVEWQHVYNGYHGNVFWTESHPIYDEIFATGSSLGEVNIWNIKTHWALRTFQECNTILNEVEFPIEIFDGGFAKDGKNFVVCTGKGNITFYSIFDSDAYLAVPMNQCQDVNPTISQIDQDLIEESKLDFMLGPKREIKANSNEYNVQYSQRYIVNAKEHLFFENVISDAREQYLSYMRRIQAERDANPLAQPLIATIPEALQSTQEDNIDSGPDQQISDHQHGPNFTDWAESDPSDGDFVVEESPRRRTNQNNSHSSPVRRRSSHQYSKTFDEDEANYQTTARNDGSSIFEFECDESFDSVDDNAYEEEKIATISRKRRQVSSPSPKKTLKCKKCKSSLNIVCWQGHKNNKNKWEKKAKYDKFNCLESKMSFDLQVEPVLTWFDCLYHKFRNEQRKSLIKETRRNTSFIKRNNYFAKIDRGVFSSFVNYPCLYCPQVGDEVYFIYQGYEDAMRKYSYYFVTPEDENKSLLSEQSHQKSPPTLWRVTDIEYRLPSAEVYTLMKKNHFELNEVMQVYAKVTLTYKRARDSSEQVKYILFFHSNDSRKYLVPKQVYEDAFAEDMSLINDTVVDWITYTQSLISMTPGPQSKKVKILKIDDYEPDVYPNSIYNCLSAIEVDSEVPVAIRLCPWELEMFGKTKIQTIPQTWSIELSKLFEDQDQVFGFTSRQLVFYDEVNSLAYPDYLQKVPVMVYILLIQQRIENDYYRSHRQLLHDINQILLNCRIYNPVDSIIWGQAKQLTRKLTAAVSRILSSHLPDYESEGTQPNADIDSDEELKYEENKSEEHELKRDRTLKIVGKLLGDQIKSKKTSSNSEESTPDSEPIMKKRDVKRKQKDAVEIVEDTPNIFLLKNLANRVKSKLIPIA